MKLSLFQAQPKGAVSKIVRHIQQMTKILTTKIVFLPDDVTIKTFIKNLLFNARIMGVWLEQNNANSPKIVLKPV